jgi:hypothetical protein
MGRSLASGVGARAAVARARSFVVNIRMDRLMVSLCEIRIDHREKPRE